MLQKVSQQHTFVWSKDSNRKAVIEYRGNVFFSCCFSGVNKVYDIDDWEFLGEVSKQIMAGIEK